MAKPMMVIHIYNISGTTSCLDKTTARLNALLLHEMFGRQSAARQLASNEIEKTLYECYTITRKSQIHISYIMSNVRNKNIK